MVLVMGTGTFGYYLFGGGRWSLEDCLYMTVITLTTVGYGEVLPGMEHVPHVRTFTIAILIVGIGILAYFVSTMTALIIEGDLKRALRKTRMRKRIEKLEGHVIVCGVGATGKIIVEELIHTGNQVVCVDRNGEELEELDSHHPETSMDYIVGDATDDEALIAANIASARGLVAALPGDKDNLYVVVSARQLNAKLRIVARGSELQVLEKLRKAGADQVVSPEYIGGLRMVSEMVRPHVVKFLDEMLRDKNAKFRIEEVAIPIGSPLVGRKLGQTNFRADYEIQVLAIRDADQGKYLFNPSADVELGADDTLVVLGPLPQVVRLRKELGDRTSLAVG
jgi:voltage-gated potassium channel